MEETFEVSIGENKVIAYKNVNGDKLEPGDLYVAKRNTGWEILKCKEVRNNLWCVVPDADFKDAYWYDLPECFKVKEVIV